MLNNRNEFAQLLKDMGLTNWIVEVGVNRGDNALHYVNAGCFRRMFLVDTWYPVNGWKPGMLGEFIDMEPNQNYMQTANDDYIHTCARFCTSPRVVVMRLESMIAARMFAPDSLDFVYLDASHYEEDVDNDLVVWTAKVRPGGIVAGHDYNLREPNRVAASVNKYYSAHSTIEIQFTQDKPQQSWWFVKPNNL
jgi:hypothetical protein